MFSEKRQRLGDAADDQGRHDQEHRAEGGRLVVWRAVLADGGERDGEEQGDTDGDTEDAATTTTAANDSDLGTAQAPPGTDPVLDALWSECAAGDDDARVEIAESAAGKNCIWSMVSNM